MGDAVHMANKGANLRASGSRDSDHRHSFYSIGDLAREFGVTLRALRFYEHRGLLHPRREGTTRLYDQKEKERLSVILKGKQLGFTLTEIRALLAKTGRNAGQADLPLSDDQVVSQLQHLESQREAIDAAIGELRGKYPHIRPGKARA
jgi:DNA-binding transcriptional MerR regulator